MPIFYCPFLSCRFLQTTSSKSERRTGQFLDQLGELLYILCSLLSLFDGHTQYISNLQPWKVCLPIFFVWRQANNLSGLCWIINPFISGGKIWPFDLERELVISWEEGLMLQYLDSFAVQHLEGFFAKKSQYDSPPFQTDQLHKL